MATLLLLVIYLAYIGLGIPDSLFGTAWPAIYRELGLPLALGSCINILISTGTVLSSLFSVRVTAKLGAGKVCDISTALTALGLLGWSFTRRFAFFCLMSLPLGLGAGAIDVALNSYVTLHYPASSVSFLHCFYGLGVTVSPYLLSRMIGGPLGWRGGYRAAAGIQAGIALALFLALPLWRRALSGETDAERERPRAIPLREQGRIPGVKLMWLVFFCSCALEWVCGGWGSTFLVERRQLAAERAALALTFYYFGLALGRFLSGLLAMKKSGWQIVGLCKWVIGAGLAGLLLPLPAPFAAAGLFLMGLGVGPLFPSFSYLTPQSFGAGLSLSLMGSQMAAANVGVMLTPALCGLLGQTFGMGIYPYYLLAFFLLFLFAERRLRRLAGRNHADTIPQ